MAVSRVSKRSGYGVNRGATNPKMTVNDTAPLNPKNKDLWLDTSSSPAVLKYYDIDTASWET